MNASMHDYAALAARIDAIAERIAAKAKEVALVATDSGHERGTLVGALAALAAAEQSAEAALRCLLNDLGAIGGPPGK